MSPQARLEARRGKGREALSWIAFYDMPPHLLHPHHRDSLQRHAFQPLTERTWRRLMAHPLFAGRGGRGARSWWRLTDGDTAAAPLLPLTPSRLALLARMLGATYLRGQAARAIGRRDMLRLRQAWGAGMRTWALSAASLMGMPDAPAAETRGIASSAELSALGCGLLRKGFPSRRLALTLPPAHKKDTPAMNASVARAAAARMTLFL